MEYEKNPFSLKINDSVVDVIYQRNLKKKYYCCASTNNYFCPTEAENLPSEDNRWMHFDMADKCDIYLNNVRVEHVVASFDLGQYRVAGEKRANMSFLTQCQLLLNGQIRYFVVKDAIDFLNFKFTLLNSKNEKLIFKNDIDPVFVIQWIPIF